MLHTTQDRKIYLSEIANKLFLPAHQEFSPTALVGEKNAEALDRLCVKLKNYHQLRSIRELWIPAFFFALIVTFFLTDFTDHSPILLNVIIIMIVLYVFLLFVRMPSTPDLTANANSPHQLLHISMLEEKLAALKSGQLVAKYDCHIIPKEIWSDTHIALLIDYQNFRSLLLPKKYARSDIEIHRKPKAAQ